MFALQNKVIDFYFYNKWFIVEYPLIKWMYRIFTILYECHGSKSTAFTNRVTVNAINVFNNLAKIQHAIE